MILRIRKRRAILVVLLLATAAIGFESVAVTASGSPLASSAKKCKKGKVKKHGKCVKKKPKIMLTNCPTTDLTPNVPYTFTGRVVPARAGLPIVMQYFDQGTAPLATHTVKTAKGGGFSDAYAYPGTGIRRGGTVRANSTKAIDPVCDVTIAAS